MSEEREYQSVRVRQNDESIDAETARLFLANVDLKNVERIVVGIDDMLMKVPEEVRTHADVIYSSMVVITNAILEMQMSREFRKRILAGMGDVMAAMLVAGLDKIEGEVDETGDAEAVDVPPEKDRSKFDALVDIDVSQVFDIEEFEKLVKEGALTDDDGAGYPAVKRDADTYYANMRLEITPSEFKKDDAELGLEGATHVVWYSV